MQTLIQEKAQTKIYQKLRLKKKKNQNLNINSVYQVLFCMQNSIIQSLIW